MSDTFHKPGGMNSQQRATQALKGIYCLLYLRQIQAGFSKDSYSSAKGGKKLALSLKPDFYGKKV